MAKAKSTKSTNSKKNATKTKEVKVVEEVKKEEKVKKVTKKTTKKPEVKKEKKQSFSKGLKSEMSKVKWPEGKEVAKYTVATIVLCLFLGGFFELLNLIFSFVKGLFS